MKPWLSAAAVALLATSAIAQEIITYSNTEELDIPDNGLSEAMSYIDVPETTLPDIAFVQVSVTLEVSQGSRGFTGDLYAYVTHNGESVVLLNRPGRSTELPFGYDDDIAMEVTFSDSAGADIHNYRQTLNGSENIPVTFRLTGLWQPDGRGTDPDDVLDLDSRTQSLSDFAGMEAAGEWAIVFGDASTGASYTLQGWSITIATIPEPGSCALITLGVVFLCGRRKPTFV